MSVILPPWIITKTDPDNDLRKFFILHVNSYNIDLEIKDKNNIIQTPVMLLFQSKEKAKLFNQYKWDSYAIKNTVINSLDNEQINTITCDLKKDDFLGHSNNSDNYEYVQVSETEDSLLKLLLFDNVELFYVDKLNIINQMLSMQGMILNSSKFMEIETDPGILHNIRVEYFNNKLFMEY